MAVYLLHFSQKLHHAQHYLGYAENIEERIARHQAGNGARLVEAFTQAGIGFVLARTWSGGRDLERHLKNQKNSPARLCPICRTGRS
jgi:predicted GIY-YIG superfamily endonuclease